MQKLPVHSELEEFHSLHKSAKTIWVTNSRPDIICEVAKRIQITEESFKEKIYKCINSVKHIVKHLHENFDIALKYPNSTRTHLGLFPIQMFHLLLIQIIHPN